MADGIPKGTYGKRARPPTPRGQPPGAANPPAARARSRSPYRRPGGRGRAAAGGFALGRILPGGAQQGAAGHMLTAQLLVGAVIVAVRAVGDYQLTADGTTRGTLTEPANGGYGPFTILAGLIGTFFGLSFLAAGGGRRAKTAVAAGFLIIVVLMLKSMDEIETVGAYITADPASRTVTTAAFSSGATQPWGAAAQVADASQAVDLTAAFSGGSSGGSSAPFFGSLFSLGSSAGAAGTTAATSAAGASSATPVNVTSSFPTVNPGGSITPGK